MVESLNTWDRELKKPEMSSQKLNKSNHFLSRFTFLRIFGGPHFGTIMMMMMGLYHIFSLVLIIFPCASAFFSEFLQMLAFK